MLPIGLIAKGLRVGRVASRHGGGGDVPTPKVKVDFKFKAGDDPTEDVEKAIVRGLRLAAEHVLTEANDRVPIEEGTLMRSGKTSVDERDLRAAVSYDTPYAVAVHEDMSARHDAGRTAKWLEQALAAEADTVRRIIAEEVRKAL